VGVVTGGASGIGRALAMQLASHGTHIVVADVDEPGLATTVEAIRAKGGQALAVPTDVTDRLQVRALAERAVATFGGVHLLCNNAGVAVWGGLESASYRDWQWVLGVNLWGVIHGLEAFLPGMIARRQGGHILNTASMAGLVASQGLGVYNTSKYAVVGLSETLAKDLRPYGIGVSVLCPMAVATAINASERNRPPALRNDGASASQPVALMGRTLSAEEVASMAVAAIRADRLYAITHFEGLEPLRRRFHRLEQAILGAAP
jgi:NAD(P)-dependent dehydrogenase (short-subunit alcohol dehydrogenase family)